MVQSFGGYNEDYQIAQDYDFWTRIMRHCRVANLSERLVQYRHLETSLSKSRREKAFQEADQIACREEKNSFRRDLQPEERLLVQAFREGRDVKQQATFLKLFKKLKLSTSSISEKIAADQQRLEAIYHLQSAGSEHQNCCGLLKEVVMAFLASPLYTLGWLKSRFFFKNSNKACEKNGFD